MLGEKHYIHITQISPMLSILLHYTIHTQLLIGQTYVVSFSHHFKDT